MPTDKLATEVALIRRIARRALDIIPTLRHQRVLSVDLQGEIAACHYGPCPLRLEALLNADTYTFVGDVLGIRRCIDRDAGTLTGYLPICRQRHPAPRQRAAA